METSQKVSESMRILRYLEEHGEASAEQIATEINVPLQTLNRALATLREFKFVSRTSTRKWKLGISLLRIAETVPSQLLEVAKDQVEHLAVLTGGSAILAIPNYPNFVVIMERDGRQGPLRLETLASVGYSLKLAPPGIAILAHLPPEQIDALVVDDDRGELVRQQCEHVREFGWAIVPSLVIKGRHGISAPIFEPDGGVGGSLTIAMPSTQLSNLDYCVEPLLTATAKISAGLRTSALGRRKTSVSR